jgi:hypothetical protein
MSSGIVVVLSILHVLLMWTSSQTQEHCAFGFEGRIRACGDGGCPGIFTESNGEYTTRAIVDGRVEDFKNSYDVHAYRLCGEEQADDITLADAISRGQRCPDRATTEGKHRVILFQGCEDFFSADSEDHQDLTIYAYNDVETCNNSLLHQRFLLINGTSSYTDTIERF